MILIFVSLILHALKNHFREDPVFTTDFRWLFRNGGSTDSTSGFFARWN